MIIVRNDIKPDTTIYYLASVFIDLLISNPKMNIEQFIVGISNQLRDVSINNIYYTLDWLYLLNLIEINDKGEIQIEIK
uniref:ABC-three component system middle component 6 n=1 Tax=Metasolibacillus sp. FSL K6-0083 TaxID=2921416 RepID=UPI00406D2B54